MIKYSSWVVFRLVKPDTALNHVRYLARRMRRIHRREFKYTGKAIQLVKRAQLDFVLVEGMESLAPSRKEPITYDEKIQMLRTPDGTRVKSSTIKELRWDSWCGVNYRAMMLLAADAGFRKDEMTGFNALKMSRASIFWVIGGKIIRNPSADQLLALSNNDFCGVLVAGSKNDPFGLHFSVHPIFVRFNDSDEDNSARALRDLILRCPVKAEDLRSTPLFSCSANFSPFSPTLVDRLFEATCSHCMTAQRFAEVSWHSWRVTLATNLQAAGAPPAVIMALLRWRSEAMLLVYARWSAEDYARWVDSAHNQSITVVQGTNVPAPAADCNDEREAVPGALRRDVYAALDAAHLSPTAHLNAAQLSALAQGIPEIDGSRFQHEMPAAARALAKDINDLDDDDDDDDEL